MTKFLYNDGGRAETKSGKKAGDCVARAIAIASGFPYGEIHDRLTAGNYFQRGGRTQGKGADFGVITQRKWFKDLMREWGFTWTPTMKIGSGCQTHLRADELPRGRLVCSVSRHYVAVIDGVINDTHDCSRGGTRCVYGYWMFCGA